MVKARTTTERRGLFQDRLTKNAGSLAPAARKVVRFIDQNRAIALASSAVDIATWTGTSDATVIRAVQALGFAGLGELKQALVAAIDRPSTPADAMRVTLKEIGESTGRAVDLVLDAHDDALKVLRSEAGRSRLMAAVAALHPAERIVVFGIGPSAALAAYGSTLLRRSGRRTATLNRTGLMLADQLLDLRAGDALLVIAYGDGYREVAAVFAEARRLGLPTVLVTDSLSGQLKRFADVGLAIPRGRTERVALHGGTLVGIETLVLGLAAINGNVTMTTLERLNDLRGAVGGREHAP